MIPFLKRSVLMSGTLSIVPTITCGFVGVVAPVVVVEVLPRLERSGRLVIIPNRSLMRSIPRWVVLPILGLRSSIKVRSWPLVLKISVIETF